MGMIYVPQRPDKRQEERHELCLIFGFPMKKQRENVRHWVIETKSKQAI
jgi:hypothetical protein